MKGEIVFRGDNRIVARLEDGTLLAHDISEWFFVVGEQIETLDSVEGSSMYAVATNGHVYLTVDFASKGGEISETGYITETKTTQP